MRNIINNSIVLLITVITGCSSHYQNQFYRHSWDYYHKPDYYNGPDMPDTLYMSEEERSRVDSEFCKNVLTPYSEKIKSDLPARSQIILKGGGGCMSYCPYNLFIVNIDGLVLAKIETEEEENLYFEILTSIYDQFWTEYLSCRDELNLNSYGKSFSTGDYGFQLTLSFKRLDESYSKSYDLVGGCFFCC